MKFVVGDVIVPGPLCDKYGITCRANNAVLRIEEILKEKSYKFPTVSVTVISGKMGVGEKYIVYPDDLDDAALTTLTTSTTSTINSKVCYLLPYRAIS